MQSPLNTSLAQQNTSKYKQLIQIRNKITLAERKPQVIQSQIPPIKTHSTTISKSHHPIIKSVLFAPCHSTIQSCISSSKNSNLTQSSSETKYINKITNSMPSKKRITRVRFNTGGNVTRPASLRSNSPSNSRAANQQIQPKNNSREANPTINTTPTSSTHSSNASTLLTPSPHVPTFEHIVSKIFNKSLIASLKSKDTVLKDVRDCILITNESRLKALNPYIHSFWRDLHVRSGCVCLDEKVAIPKVLREALIDDIHSSPPGTWGMICMATHCWWPYLHRELIVKAIECKPCTVIDEDTVMPEEILPDDKWVNGYRSYIEVEIGVSRATDEAKDRERASTDGEYRFFENEGNSTNPL